MANILLVTHWTSGDVYPFIQIGTKLLEHGHQVTLFSHSPYREISESSGISFVSWDTQAEWEEALKDMSQLANTLVDLETFDERLNDFHKKYQGHAAYLSEYEKIAKQCTSSDTVIVGRYNTNVSSLLISETLNIPLVSIILSPSYIGQIDVYQDLFASSMVEEINLARDKLDLEPLPVNAWSTWMNSPKRHIGLWSKWFAPIESHWPDALKLTGFPLENSFIDGGIPLEAQALLKQERVILITGGTGTTILPKLYEVGAEACNLLGYTGILVTPHAHLVPKNLPSNVRWFDFLPLNSIMPHIDAIIHHGGIGTLSQAIAAGIPQIALATNADRPYNASKLETMGVGKFLPPVSWQHEKVADQLRMIMSPNFRQNCKKFADLIQRETASDSACELIEEAIGNRSFIVSQRDYLSEEVFQKTSLGENPAQIENNSQVTNNLSADQLDLLTQLLRQKNG